MSCLFPQTLKTQDSKNKLETPPKETYDLCAESIIKIFQCGIEGVDNYDEAPDKDIIYNKCYHELHAWFDCMEANKDYYDKVLQDGDSGISWDKCAKEAKNDENIANKCKEKLSANLMSVVGSHYNIDFKDVII